VRRRSSQQPAPGEWREVTKREGVHIGDGVEEHKGNLDEHEARQVHQ
jgi:hypothetical protein